MAEGVLIADDPTGPGSNSLFSDLLLYLVDSVPTCLSQHADRRCVLIGLSCLCALFTLLSRLLLVCQGCRCRGETPGEATIVLYCFLGNLCSTVGAILSKQLYVLVLIGAFAAAVDFVSVMCCCLPLFLCWNWTAERRLRVMRRRRRQHLLAVCVLMVVAGGFLKPDMTLRDRLLSGRRLLHVAPQDNTEVLGYILGLVAFVIVCTSRFPSVCRVYRGQVLSQAYVLSGLLCSLAGALYAAAILLYDTQIGFLLRVTPWLLSATCCVTLDLLILVLHWCKRGARQQCVSFSLDTERLLDDSDICTMENSVTKNRRKPKLNSSSETKKMNDMGRYMDVSFHPMKKIRLQKMTLAKEEAEDRPLDRTVRLIKIDTIGFSDTSCESSSDSSDLEWDFEDTNDQWRETREKQQEGNGFPPLEQPANTKPVNFCTCALSGLPQKMMSSKQEADSVPV